VEHCCQFTSQSFRKEALFIIVQLESYDESHVFRNGSNDTFMLNMLAVG